jgi:hypothetical protein
MLSAPQESGLTQAQIEAFFDAEVRPALDAYSTRNQTMVDRAVDRIANGIDAYRQGIPPFVDDITSWGTRFGVIGRGSQDLWETWWGAPSNATRVHDYVSEKFERHLFSDVKLIQMVETSLNQFRDDLKASQNLLHAEVESAWDSRAYASQQLDLKHIVAQVNARVHEVSSTFATNSVTVGVLAFVGGFALEETTEALVKVIVARVATYLATSAATSSATSGGATGTGAAVGGAGGFTIGPWGTVIGVAVGIVVGMIADWWMTNQFEKKLTAECEDMLDKVKAQILTGTNETPGVKQAFIESITVLNHAEEHAVHGALMERAK